jgi:hypothetical protein
MTGFQESDPGVEGRRFEAFQMAISGARVGKASSFRVARDTDGAALSNFASGGLALRSRHWAFMLS